jgi:hypothetical protein
MTRDTPQIKHHHTKSHLAFSWWSFKSSTNVIHCHPMSLLSTQFISYLAFFLAMILFSAHSSGSLYFTLITLMMEAARTSEKLVNFSQTTRCYNPEDSHLRTHHRENLKSYSILCLLESGSPGNLCWNFLWYFLADSYLKESSTKHTCCSIVYLTRAMLYSTECLTEKCANKNRQMWWCVGEVCYHWLLLLQRCCRSMLG